MVNFYNSPGLAGQLKIEHSTACVGTLKLNRKNIPKEVSDKKNEERKNHSKTFGFSHDTKMVWQKKYNYGVNIPQSRHTEGF